MPLKYIYIDSNPFDRLHFCQTLKRFDNLKLMAEFSDAVNASEFLNYNEIDFAIISSDLPVYDGFEFSDQLKQKIEIVMLTKNPQDAIKAFEEGFVDCLQKPVSHERFKKTVDKLVKRITPVNLSEKKEDYFIHFKCNLKSEKVLVNNIKWIEAMGDYVKIVTQNKSYVVLSSMKAFISRLPENQFVRIHKSYIVNLKKVINHDSNKVFMDGKLLPLSRNQKLTFKKNFAKYQ
ncbi:LytTR family DNA-binding domain-containing protein [Flavobacteriaceae bacterium]|nr:LytTR family DNA-binding domain-containing protein [Flavobacteriaceae bacterium]